MNKRIKGKLQPRHPYDTTVFCKVLHNLYAISTNKYLSANQGEKLKVSTNAFLSRKKPVSKH